MNKFLIAAAVLGGLSVSAAQRTGRVEDLCRRRWHIDVQKLSCAQLAGTFQEDADLLMTWYSGWYNGLGKKHFINVPRSKEAQHEIIVYCKANPKVTVIKAIGLVFDQMRKERGIVLAKSNATGAADDVVEQDLAAAPFPVQIHTALR